MDTRKDGKAMRIMRRLMGQDVDLMDKVEEDAEYAEREWAPENKDRAKYKVLRDLGHNTDTPTGVRAREEMKQYGRKVKMKQGLGEDSRTAGIDTQVEDPQGGTFFTNRRRKK